MKAAVLSHEVAAELTHSRLADYVALTKPRISVLVLFTVGAGAFLVIWWARHWHRTRRSARLVASGAHPASGAAN